MIDLINAMNTETGQTIVMGLVGWLAIAMLAELVLGWKADQKAERRHQARLRVIHMRHEVTMRRLKDRYGTRQTERY
jgi:hypothetical protein